jgi:biopolymer transport protein ExbD
MAFGNGLDDDEDVMSEINMTPLVDVMLVLLIIFIIAMPLLNQAVKVDLPRVDSSPAEQPPKVVTLSVTTDGAIHWNHQIITNEELSRRLQRAAQQQPQPEIHLRGDRQVDYEYVMKVIAAVQREGMVRLGFITEPES